MKALSWNTLSCVALVIAVGLGLLSCDDGGGSRAPALAVTYLYPAPEYLVGLPIVPNTPRVTSGSPPTSYETDPSRPLPDGLGLDAETGVISGIPTADGDRTVNIRAMNGSTTVAVPIRVKVTLPRSRQVYAASPAGDTISIMEVAAGKNGALELLESVRTGDQPVQLAMHPSQEVLYVLLAGDREVAAYQVDPSPGGNGSLKAVGTNRGTGLVPTALRVHPGGRAAYVLNTFAGTIWTYDVESSGALETPGRAVKAGTLPAAMTLDPAGDFLYVVDSDGILVFPVGDGGKPSQGKRAITASGLGDLVVAPSGKFAYVVDGRASRVRVYSLSGGALKAEPQLHSPDPTGFFPSRISMDLAGRGIYVTSLDKGITVFPVDPGDNSLGEAASTSLSAIPTAVSVEPSGRFAYVGLEGVKMNTGTYSVLAKRIVNERSFDHPPRSFAYTFSDVKNSMLPRLPPSSLLLEPWTWSEVRPRQIVEVPSR